MDRFYPPHGLPSDSIPFGRGLGDFTRQTETPPTSVSDGVRLDPSHHRDPCSAIGNWACSSSASPGEPMLLSPQHHYPWKMALPPSLPAPTSLPERGLPRLLPSHRLETSARPSSLAAAGGSRTRQLKPGLRRLDDSKAPTEWLREPGSISSCSHESPSSYRTSSGISRPDACETACPTASLPPPSPAISALTYHSLKLETPDSPDNIDDKPYSKLIEMALKTNPEKKLSLQGIYNWFEQNTAKGRDLSSKGWQNSVRHNLSMNAGFEAVREEPIPGKKAVNYWRLTNEAIKNGVQSTTRYRKQASYRKALGSDPPAPQRQRSGAKGGKATKVKPKFRGRMSEEELPKGRYHPRVTSQPRPTKNVFTHYHTSAGTLTEITIMSPFQVSGLTPSGNRLSSEPFDLGSVVGCADPAPCPPLFCDMAGPGPDCVALDSGFLGWGAAVHSLPTGLLGGPGISTDLQIGV
ncbi:hypothetical protein BO83DRAFT_201083 [Aspergillus eucalypticola CBS 122712]|uniref:Fork-head domain-containing protein n=1 Tax=Aspergillus eucalypticola (strain CBS 122712 / IBT 29274) TaxID=1448314 RepID=A0A317W406_ASPEC|nr:uncharacterized protein BO83DRAFT_201083 [Aspergillus eucalypticola CBS 122712]PWY80007.1 hypothetical protein BO83DRAFT_201083 [Aspergillus eucalypticola CBS 122712]